MKCLTNTHVQTMIMHTPYKTNKISSLLNFSLTSDSIFFKPLQISFHEKESVLNLHPDVHVNQTHEIMTTKILFSRQ